MAEGIREDLCPLLDKGRSGGRIQGIEEEIAQQLLVEGGAPHGKDKIDGIPEAELPVTCEISVRVPDEGAGVSRHFVDNAHEGVLHGLCEWFHKNYLLVVRMYIRC